MKICIMILSSLFFVSYVLAQSPPDPPMVSKCGCIFICPRHRVNYEMELYYERENKQQLEKLDAINNEYYRRTGRKPTPYWEMPY